MKPLEKRDYDAIVVGSGPNGLAAAIVLQQAGKSVLLVEAKPTIGGGMRTAELTLPGFHHDIGSAIHPLGADSPFFKALPLNRFGLEFITPPVAAAHPFDEGSAALLTGSVSDTARLLGTDARAYERLMTQPVRDWPGLAPDLLGPLTFPKHPLAFAQFGLKALPSAQVLADLYFKTDAARGLWAGMAAHSMQPFTNLTTASVALVLLLLGHRVGWPLPRGGSQKIADALAGYFVSLGGHIQANTPVRSLGQLPSAHAILLDITPRQVLAIAGERLSPLYRWQLSRYRYGMGIFKMDWALDGPVPFTNPDCHRAGTIHIGGSLEEIAAGERAIANGQHPDKPFVLLAQQSRFDDSRAPAGKHTVWAYCHTPNGSRVDQTEVMERQIERFAPGFRERILGRHVMDTAAVETWNENYIGGDINGGVQDATQLFTRPALRFSPYRTSAKGIYICSSSTPPGGGVHGMGGYHAARRALQDVFGEQTR